MKPEQLGGYNTYNVPIVPNEYTPEKMNSDLNAHNNVHARPKENPNKQNSVYSKIKDPYKNYKSINSTMPMPSTYSINFNIPNANPFVPPYAQTPIPMTPIPNANPFATPYGQTPVPMAPVPMPFGPPLYAPYQPDIIKKYNVNISTGDLGNIKHIYEDMVPKNNSIHDRYATTSERLNIANYYGLIFNKHYYHYTDINTTDIQNKVGITDSNLSNLLGHIKVNYYNSYYKSNNQSSANALVDLANAPDNFIMFNVCFPIKYDNNQLTCAEDSLRGNIRIYKLFNINTTTPSLTEANALNKVFFELLYYKKIQDLIKINKYPNFVLSYGVIVAPCKIDFTKMNELKLKSINNLSGIYNNQNVSTSTSTNSLLILTESVNYNIIQWASKQYDRSDNDKNNFYVSTVISTGVRSVEAWKSVIFQLLIAMYILHSNGIGFKNFSLKDNVFIKKIDITPPVIKYWKYIIDGAEYYVPNHGFLVMIDSNFINNNGIDINNIVIDGTETNHLQPSGFTYNYKTDINMIINTKISEIFNYLSNPPESVIIPNDINLKNIFSTITNKVNSLTGQLTDDEFKTIITENFNFYLYEKLGHIIPESELNEYKLLEYDKKFKIGDLVLYKKFSKAYIISSYIGTNKISTNETSLNDYNEKTIDFRNFTEVNVSEDLITKFKYKSSKEIIETYYIP